VEEPKKYQRDREALRRVKTQGALPTEDAVLALLYDLVASGQVEIRKINGYKDMPETLTGIDKAA
jgi:hypothetical protein